MKTKPRHLVAEALAAKRELRSLNGHASVTADVIAA